MRLRPLITAVLLCAAAAEARAAPNPTAPADRFVRVKGNAFTLDGKPFYFLGANAAVMHGPTERRGYRLTLDAARADGLRVVRIWALGEGPTKASTWLRRWHLFRAGPQGWIPGTTRHLDKVMAHARRLGLRVILTLANNWDAYGGVPQYLRWARLGTAKYGALDRFFSNARTRRWYRQHVERLVNRRSTVTGLRYSDDPTIMAWELFNESTVTPGGFAPRRRLIRRMAKRIRTLAPQQLVSAGVTGYATLTRRAEWLKVCRLRELDFCDAHLYPEESWRLRRPRDLDETLDDRVQLAHHVAKKPILFGEFGFTEGVAKRKDLGRRSQRWWVSRFLRRVYFNGAAGALIWLYIPHSTNPRRFPIWVNRKHSMPLRRVLRRWAKRFTAGPPRRLNPRLGAKQGTRPLYKTQLTLKRRPPRRRWNPLPGPPMIAPRRRVVLQITDFKRVRFADVGYHGRGLIEHVYGAGHGFWEFRVPRLRPRATSLLVTLRLSSEYPGAKAPATGFSQVVVRVAGRVVARLRAAPDDGQGRPVRISIRDPRLLAQLRRRALILRLEVPWGKHARGLCIYGSLGLDGVLKKHLPAGDLGPIRITATLARKP